MRALLSRLRLPLAVLAVLGVALGPAAAGAAPAGISADGQRLLLANGQPAFLLGMNYEGPSDRAWQMWDDDKFDPGLIDADFQKAAAAGTPVVRVFVQSPLAKDIAAGKWDKLDKVVGLAEARGIQLIVTLLDYGERDVSRAAATAGKVAQRYRGRPGVLSYDLKNEPHFGDLALARYPTPPPLQQPGLIQTYGERLARADVPGYRASDEGVKSIPSDFSDDQAYVYGNNVRLYREFLAQAGDWVKAHNYQATTLDFIADPAGQKWAPLLSALDGTLHAWIQPQADAIRAADPGKPLTLAQVDAVLASLPANDILDYETLHRYAGATGSSVRSALSLESAIQQAHQGKPIVLGEFGYASTKVDPSRSAVLETATFLGLLAQNAAGGAKWVLNDMPDGYNMDERTMGAYSNDGSPKPIVGALSALSAYLGTSGSPPGQMRIDDDPDAGARYVYQASDALLLGGKQVDGGVARFSASGPAQAFFTWADPSQVHIWASGPMQVEVTPDKLVGAAPTQPPVLARASAADKPLAISSPSTGKLAFSLDQPGAYVLRLGTPPPRAADYDIPAGHFFTQTNGRGAQSPTGYSVTNADAVPFWDAFNKLGGVDVLGYPVTRRFQYAGFTTQAFQKAVLQFRPDQGGAVWFANTFDIMHDLGKDAWLESQRQTPPPADTKPDVGLPWDKVVARHLAMLDKVPQPLHDAFLADPDWIDHYGLPVATADYPNSVVIRAQRAAFQYWKQDVPWAKKGDVTIANGGDLAKEAGVWPQPAVTPENAPQ